MLLTRSLWLFALSLCICFASVVSADVAEEVAEAMSPLSDDTTEAVVKAVVTAENKPKATGENAKKDAENKEASAVAMATTEVLEAETEADDTVPERVIWKASDDAKKTYKDLAESGVDSKAAADAAAKVAVATVDGASDLTLPHEAKKNAEKAAVAAGKAVADHPDNEGKAIQEAISTVKEEEKTYDKVDLKEKPKGLVSKAEAAAEEIPKLAKDVVVDGAEAVEHPSRGGMFMIFIFLGMIGFGVKYYQDNVLNSSPYTEKLNAIREEFNGVPRDTSNHDIETQYSAFEEYSEFPRFR